MKARLLFALLLPCFVLAQDDPPPWPILKLAADEDPLPNTAALDWEGDIASRMIGGIDKFLLGEIEASVEGREPTREKLAKMLGVGRDVKPEHSYIEYADWVTGPRAEGVGFEVRQVRWRAFRDVHGVGLLFEPKGVPLAEVIAIPDADQRPEDIASLPPLGGVPKTNAYACS